MNTEQNSEEVSTNESVASNEVVSKMTIGEFLRSAREERNLSLKVISQHTKISVTILENIENNTFENLPSKAYVIGFVKSYSKTINLDEAECLKLLNEAYGGKPQPTTQSVQAPLKGTPPTNPPVEASSSKEIPSQYLTIAGVFVALVILFAIVINNTNNNPREEIVAEEQSLEKEVNQTPLVDVKPQEVSENTPLTQQPEVEEPSTEEEVVVAEETEPEPEPEVEVTATEPVKTEEIKVEETKKEIVEKKKEETKITLRSLPMPLYEISSDKEVYTYLPESIKAALIKDKQNIFINAVDGDTWITYKSDNDDIKKFVLSKGRTLLIRGDIVRIFLGNVNVARIFLNNKALEITSRSGVKSLIFPQEQAKNYKLPLFIYPKPGQVITSSEYEESLSN
ncbi:helix-turn-helix domain-containing protein [Halobacteriovorax sp. JY17]|uniref:helix-turn-helix domain-containing protein n=1 Tax=Halobacteriovorax sp. JY17 TaxID=2014617 RepID=UPI000C4AA0D9|nr:helix-turn-helix domain-containing protein [Halobacteriovorax sp. JY17]PIK13887.1 MAG: hypothetical protein CES88_12945 [Halobacteriovorax sp. JY17]